MDPQPTPASEVTRILSVVKKDSGALNDLAPLVYDELRAIARQRLSRERSGHTLQATALVNEAWMRLVDDKNLDWPTRRHFFAAASEAMRRVLVDHARKVKAERRGGGKARLSFTVAELVPVGDDPDRVLLLDEALTGLEKDDPRAAEVARLRLFAGLSPEECAEALDVSVRSAGRDWTYARTRLMERLGNPPDAA